MRRTILLALGFVTAVTLTAILLSESIPIEAIGIGAGVVVGFGISVLLFGAALLWPSTRPEAGSSYPIDRPSPAKVRSFWVRLVARVDEPVPIGA